MSLAKNLVKGIATISFAKQAINRVFNMTTEQVMEFCFRLYAEVYLDRDMQGS
jgi:hypothetical protein